MSNALAIAVGIVAVLVYMYLLHKRRMEAKCLSSFYLQELQNAKEALAHTPARDPKTGRYTKRGGE